MTDTVLLKTKPSQISESDFLKTYGGVYEHSSWVADAVWAGKQGTSLDSVDDLHDAMRIVVDAATEEAKVTLICAHPDLAGKAAVDGSLTEDSKSEQSGAGLDKCNEEEFEAFQTLNTAYKEKFGFPFIIAVKGLGRQDILTAFRVRLNHDREQEFQTALKQIHKIAGMRLAALT